MTKPNLPALIQANNNRWHAAKYDQHRMVTARQVAQRLCAPNARKVYEHLSALTGVPWWVIAVIHEREASQSWKANIANGQSWGRVTTIVPKGRGPFKSFNEAAVDALVNCAPHAARWKDWTAGGALTLLELYNGEGYELYHHMGSPYLWAGSNQYVRGKYVGDGEFDPSAVDHQLGCAIMLRAMQEIDASILAGHPVDVPMPPERPEVELNPDEYPDQGTVHHAPLAPVEPDDNSDGEEPDVPPSAPQPEQERTSPAAPAHPLPKPLVKSKINWLQQIMVWLGFGGLVGQADDGAQQSAADLLSKAHDTGLQAKQVVQDFGLAPILKHMLNFHTLIFAGIIIAGALTIYFRWRDHGRGSVS